MNITERTPVGTIATEHPLATRVFHRHGIDFCCGGGKPLEEACEARGLDSRAILEEVHQQAAAAEKPPVRWDQEPVAELIDHILEDFHRPLKEELPRLEAMAAKVHNVHGDKDPSLAEIHVTMQALRSELEDHMLKEEQVLFPMILRGDGPRAGCPIQAMEAEHDQAGAMLRQLRDLTGDYQVPEGACTTWRALWAGLEDLESSLHEHIHLENNILHRRALAS